jgi:starch-binding outer membrane protein, SusD/RagB family
MTHMQKRLIVFIIALGALFTACKRDFVNTQPLSDVSETAAWNDAALSEAFVTEIYNGFINGGYDEEMLSSYTDESLFTHPGRSINIITQSLSRPDQTGRIAGAWSWPNMYSRIRACNIALKKLPGAGFSDNTLKDRLRGETHYLRAFFYHQLVRYFGGVPLIDRPYELGEADYTIARNSFAECVDFIVKGCDSAILLLDGKSLAKGRATKAGALALKARILLYAASDLHDIPTAKTKSTVISAYTKPEIIGYTSGSRTDRWTKAKAAAKAVLDLPGFGYKLNLNAPVSAAEGTENYKIISMGGASKTVPKGGETELLMARYFALAKEEGGTRIGRANGPNGYHNWAGNTPIGNLVDDYEMMDGSKFDWSNPAHAAAPYTNRDPRLYATILHDGAPWKPRTADGKAKDPYGEVQTGTYELGTGGGTVSTYFGLDTRKSSIEDWNGTHTGYYMRKFLDPDPAIEDQNTLALVPWPFFRYTEAVFNYAEACIELGEETEAKNWLNKIRYRAGMPAITESGAALVARYRNERRIEMAFEEHRYHDARRWMIAPTTIHNKARIITVKGTLKAGKTVSLYRYDPSNYTYTYTPSNVDPGIEDRAWNDKMYYLPIHRDEMNRNGKLVQNPGF